MVARAPKPGGGAAGAQREAQVADAQPRPARTRAGACAGAPARTFFAWVTTGARMRREGRVPSRIWARSGAWEPRGRRLTTATSATSAWRGWWRGSATAT